MKKSRRIVTLRELIYDVIYDIIYGARDINLWDRRVCCGRCQLIGRILIQR
jgi:hypothetical protein